MRQVFAIVAALIGGYLLWTGIKFGRVLLVLDDSRFDGTMLVIAGMLAGLGFAFLALAWRLFRKPNAAQSTEPPPGPSAS